MTDRESVIIGLQNCKPSWFTVEKCRDNSCPYNRFGHENGGCVDHLIDDALELLKSQPDIIRCGECRNYRDGFCYNPNNDEKTCGNTTPDWHCADGRKGERS